MLSFVPVAKPSDLHRALCQAEFAFGTAYKYYAFGASTEAFNSANVDQEFSAVGSTVPEPGSLLLLGTVVLALGFGAMKRKLSF